MMSTQTTYTPTTTTSATTRSNEAGNGKSERTFARLFFRVPDSGSAVVPPVPTDTDCNRFRAVMRATVSTMRGFSLKEIAVLVVTFCLLAFTVSLWRIMPYLWFECLIGTVAIIGICYEDLRTKHLPQHGRALAQEAARQAREGGVK
jgi:hypothetical protein